MSKSFSIIAVTMLAGSTLLLSSLVAQRQLIAPTAPQLKPQAMDGNPTASGGSIVFVEGNTTYDCTNPTFVTRHIQVSTSPTSEKLRLKVTSYVDASSPEIPERTIFNQLVGHGEMIAVTMEETPETGFGNVHFAATLYFVDETYASYGSDANVGWPHNCPTPTPTLIASPTPLTTAQCLNVVIHRIINGVWSEIQNPNILTPGTTIGVSVRGTSTNGNFDQARIKVNDSTWIETTTRNIFGDLSVEYTLPQTVQTISIQAQLHHIALGWL